MLQMKSKKKEILGAPINNFETYTRYSRVADDEQKNSWSNSLFKLSKGDNLKKEFGKPWFRWRINFCTENLAVQYSIITPYCV